MLSKNNFDLGKVSREVLTSGRRSWKLNSMQRVRSVAAYLCCKQFTSWLGDSVLSTGWHERCLPNVKLANRPQAWIKVFMTTKDAGKSMEIGEVTLGTLVLQSAI